MKDGNPLLLSDEEQSVHLIKCMLSSENGIIRARALNEAALHCAKNKSEVVGWAMRAERMALGLYLSSAGLLACQKYDFRGQPSWSGDYNVINRELFANALKSAFRTEYHELIDIELAVFSIKRAV